LRADGDILSSGHRHGTCHQSRDPCDPDVILRCGRRGNTDDQARGRDDAIVGPEHRGSQPSNAIDEVIFPVQPEAAHVCLLVTPSSFDGLFGGIGLRWPA
jgi:hypothetical protein